MDSFDPYSLGMTNEPIDLSWVSDSFMVSSTKMFDMTEIGIENISTTRGNVTEKRMKSNWNSKIVKLENEER